MYFLVEEKFSQTDDFTKSVAKLVSRSHGVTFFEFDEMTGFLHSFIEKLITIRNQYSKLIESFSPIIRYVPRNINETNQWIDITILIDNMPICRIVKAKKEVSNG